MLDLLRVHSKGWVAKILIALLVLSFAVWGISGSLFFGSQTTVVAVGETQVDVQEYRFAYENQLNAFSRNIGRRISQQEAEALGFRQNVLNQVVAGAVLDENAREMGLGVSDENLAGSIGEDPMFRDLSGNFSRTLLRSALRNAGMSEADYIESRRRVSARNQILEGTAASMSMPEAYVKALSRYQNDKRIFEYVTIGKEVATQVTEPDNTTLETYYEENKTNYMAPQYRKVAILKLEPTDLANPQEVTNEEVRDAYENRKDSLRTPERRQIEQLVLKAGTEDEVLEKLAADTPFEEIVAQQGKSLADINLGLLRRQDVPDENIAEAAFEAELGKPTDLVKGLFGSVLIRVTQIEPETTTAFEDVAEDIRNQIAAERAIEDVFAGFDAIEEERGAGETVITTGEKLNYQTRTIEAIDASGLDLQGNAVSDLPAARELLQEAFAAEPGDDTQAIEIGENGFLWYEVLDVIPERQKPFDEVRDEVVEAWKSSEIDRQVLAVAENLRDRVDAGEDFNAAIAAVLPTDSLGQEQSFSVSEALPRSGQSADIPVSAVRDGFAVKEGKMVISNLGENTQILFRTRKVADDSSDQLGEEITQRIDEAASQDILSQVVADLQVRKEVLVNQGAIDLALSPGRGQHGGY